MRERESWGANCCTVRCPCCGVVQDFKGSLGNDGKSLWLSQSQICCWFSRRAAALMRAALERALEEGEEGEEEKEGRTGGESGGR